MICSCSRSQALAQSRFLLGHRLQVAAPTPACIAHDFELHAPLVLGDLFPTWPTRTATILKDAKRTALCKECRPRDPTGTILWATRARL